MSYVAQYRGGMSQIPPGFLEAASQAGKSLGDGIADFADRISRAQEEVDNRHKAENLAAKSAEMFRKSLELSKPEGVDIPDPVQFANLDARGKAAWAQSTVASLHAAQQAQAMKESRQRMRLAADNQAFQIDAMKQRALDRELLNAAGRDLTTAEPMLPGEQGPPAIPEITPDRFLKAVGARGQLANPDTDNLLRALEMGQGRSRVKPGPGRAGTVFELGDGRKGFWNTENSAQLLPGTGPQVTGPVPKGWTVWQGPNGEQRLVKETQDKPNPEEQLLASGWTSAQAKVGQLQALKDAGHTHFTLDNNGLPQPASGWNPFSSKVDDEIEAQSKLAADRAKKLSLLRSGPGPSASDPTAPKPVDPSVPQTGEMHGVAKPTTKAEVMRLPAGSRFLNPADGKVYIKK